MFLNEIARATTAFAVIARADRESVLLDTLDQIILADEAGFIHVITSSIVKLLYLIP
jgi:hypothetical protein